MLEVVPSTGTISGAFYGHCPPNIVRGTSSINNYDFLKYNHLNNYYGFVHQNGLQQSEILKIMSLLAKFELGFSLCYVIQGGISQWRAGNWMEENDVEEFTSLCLTGILAGVAGVASSVVGVWAVSRHRWRCSMVAYLAMAVLSSVAFLLLIIHSGIWLGNAREVRGLQWVKVMTTVMLLVAVALGVCFIVSASFICHLWARRNKQRKYQLFGSLATPSPFSVTGPLLTGLGPGPGVGPPPLMGPYTSVIPPMNITMPMKTLEYHICTSQCQH